jgi:hypothetical protein
MKTLSVLPLLFCVAACTTPHRPAGFLTTYEGLAPREGTLRVDIRERRDDAALANVRRVVLAPTILLPDAKAKLGWLTEREQALLLREVDAQLCFEASERYELVQDRPDASLRAAITRVDDTNPAGSIAAAAANFFIPGPIGLRAPGSTGGLGAEAELLAPDGKQLAAMTWNRNATPVGTDDPSLSRIGDAMQFAEPFADDAIKALSAKEAKSGDIPKPDPCAEFGPRIRPEGWLTKFATGLYFPEASAAKRPNEEEPK